MPTDGAERREERAAEGWTPSFPGRQAAHDPADPATWVTPVACTGTDRHPLSVPVWHALGAGVAGAALVALDVHLHVYGRGLGTGIGLLLMPALAAMFSRWVDGPVLYYRTWGRLHQLRLDQVTDVIAGTAGSGTASVALSSPNVDKPVRVSLRARGYTMPPAARDHLRGWLGAPSVRWDPRASALFDAHTVAATRPARRRYRVARLAVGVVLPLALVSAGGYLAYRHTVARHIPGASGYRRFGGPRGKLLAVGRPWGHPCQPVRLSVEQQTPDWVYAQVADVVDEARRDGVNITLETRNFLWTPSSVYYPPGTTPASVPRIGIFAHWETPPHLPNGRPERIGLGWDAALDPDGRHEDMTDAKGDLWMQVLDGHPDQVRRSVRYLIALTQGIIRSTRRDSALAADTTIDRFTPADVAAMKLMSGCHDLALSAVGAG